MTAGYWGARAIVALAFWGCYMGLVGKPSTSEAVAGALVTAAAIALLVYLEAASGHRYRFKAIWWLDLVKLPPTVVRDAWLVSAAVIKRLLGLAPLEGHFVAVPLPDAPDDAFSEARLALAIFGTSVSPNVFLLDVDRDRRLVLLHQLVPSPNEPAASLLWWPR